MPVSVPTCRLPSMVMTMVLMLCLGLVLGATVGVLAERVGITPANLAVLKNGRAKAVRFTTLEALCEALQCQPGDLLRWEADEPA